MAVGLAQLVAPLGALAGQATRLALAAALLVALIAVIIASRSAKQADVFVPNGTVAAAATNKAKRKSRPRRKKAGAATPNTAGASALADAAARALAEAEEESSASATDVERAKASSDDDEEKTQMTPATQQTQPPPATRVSLGRPTGRKTGAGRGAQPGAAAKEEDATSNADEPPQAPKVDSYAEQVSLVCAAAMKEIAVDMGSVERMWGEDTLIKVGTRSKYNAKVDPSLAKSSDVARKACKRAIADSGAATSDTILQVVRAKAPNFLMLDANFKVEMALVEELVGEGCEGRLKAGVLAAMPTNTTRRSPADTASKMQALQMTEGFKLATRAAQEKAKAALAFVTALAEERPPDIKAAQECSFMSDVVAAAQWFLECHRDGGAPPIRGAKAFAPLVSQAQKAVADKTATLSMAAPLQLYWWLCPPASEETRKKTIKDIQAMTTGTLKAAVSASSRGSGKSTNKSKGQASGAEEAAAAMLG